MNDASYKTVDIAIECENKKAKSKELATKPVNPQQHSLPFIESSNLSSFSSPGYT